MLSGNSNPLGIPRDVSKSYRWRGEADFVPVPRAASLVRLVFAHFQNLNLRVLIEDLRRGRVARDNWSFDGDLCPVAHGLADGRTVGLLRYVSQAADLKRACAMAAEQIGAPPAHVYRVVTDWDCGNLGPDWLLRQLEQLWAERVADARLVQDLLSPGETPSSLTSL